jgi:hypothetical protein
VNYSDAAFTIGHDAPTFPGRSAARSDALQTRDRWKFRAGDNPGSARTTNIQRIIESTPPRRILDQIAASNSSLRRLTVRPAAYAISPHEWSAAVGLECQLTEKIAEHIAYLIYKAVDWHPFRLIAKSCAW